MIQKQNIRQPIITKNIFTPKPPAEVPLSTKCVASNKLKWWLMWFITFLMTTMMTMMISMTSMMTWKQFFHGMRSCWFPQMGFGFQPKCHLCSRERPRAWKTRKPTLFYRTSSRGGEWLALVKYKPQCVRKSARTHLENLCKFKFIQFRGSGLPLLILMLLFLSSFENTSSHWVD